MGLKLELFERMYSPLALVRASSYPEGRCTESLPNGSRYDSTPRMCWSHLSLMPPIAASSLAAFAHHICEFVGILHAFSSDPSYDLTSRKKHLPINPAEKNGR
jgi:hypothetical protein